MITAEQLQGVETMTQMAAKAWPILRQSGETPASLAGRLVGFGKSEPLSSIPKWAWFGVGTIAGVSAALLVWPAIKRRLG